MGAGAGITHLVIDHIKSLDGLIFPAKCLNHSFAGDGLFEDAIHLPQLALQTAEAFACPLRHLRGSDHHDRKDGKGTQRHPEVHPEDGDHDEYHGQHTGKQLGNEYAILNLGKPGASTVEETDDLQKYPLDKVDVVILQYYLNDIENAALSIGLDPKLDPTKGMPAWVNESYLANFVYWRLVARIQPAQEGTQTYWDWLYSMYDNSAVWAIHQKQLDQFADAVTQKGAKLIVVIFPNMLDPFHSVPYVDRVAQAFEAKGIATQNIVKLFDAAAAMPLTERVVSERDAHASVAFNHTVGDMLYDKVIQIER